MLLEKVFSLSDVCLSVSSRHGQILQLVNKLFIHVKHHVSFVWSSVLHSDKFGFVSQLFPSRDVKSLDSIFHDRIITFVSGNFLLLPLILLLKPFVVHGLCLHETIFGDRLGLLETFLPLVRARNLLILMGVIRCNEKRISAHDVFLEFFLTVCLSGILETLSMGGVFGTFAICEIFWTNSFA